MRTRKEEKVLGDFCNGKHNNIQIIHDSRHMLRYLDLDQSRRERKRERLTHTQIRANEFHVALREDKADRKEMGKYLFLASFHRKICVMC